MKFVVDPDIFELFPELRLGVVVATGINNKGSSPEILNKLRNAESKMRGKLSIEALAENPLISNWKKAYKILRAKDGRPSHEALIRRVVGGDEIPHINKLVDLYNCLSLEYMTPFGGEDLGKIRGEMSLKLATGSEDFMQLGSQEITHPEPNEIIYSDGEKVLCRKFNWRESELTKLTEGTSDAFFVTETLPPFSEEILDKVLGEFSENLSAFCNAKARTFILDKSNLEIMW